MNRQIPVLAVDANLIAALNNDVTQGVGERFTINIENTSTTPQKVAILSAFYDTIDKALAGDASKNNGYGSVKELNKNGFAMAATAFDGTTAITGGGSIVFASGNPTASIDAFLRYIRTNARKLKSLLITTDNRDAFNSSIELTKANPMGNGKVVPIDLNQFFSPKQYQDDRITIDFGQEPLEICDDLVMAVNIPAKAKMGFNFRF